VDRREALEREAAGWGAFLAEVDAVPPDRREVEGVVPGWSVKDLVVHCAGWARFAADHLEATDGTFTDPFGNEPDEHWDALSQDMIEASRAMSFEEALREAEEARVRARSVWSALGSPSDEAARFFSDETADHYGEHASEIGTFRRG
jgi:hypothetical protein